MKIHIKIREIRIINSGNIELHQKYWSKVSTQMIRIKNYKMSREYYRHMAKENSQKELMNWISIIQVGIN